MPLTDPTCKNASCPEGRRFVRLADAGGLYLEVTAAGSKLWRWKFRHGGKEKRLALGIYEAADTPPGQRISLAEARRKRDAARGLLDQGIDPAAARRETKRAAAAAVVTAFEPVARTWWASWKVGKTERYAGYVLARLQADAFPEIGHRPVSSLEAPDFVMMVKKIEKRGADELARRMLETCGQVMRWCVLHGLAKRNPVADVKPGDFLRPRQVENFARVGTDELPELMRKLMAYQGNLYTRMALQLMALTFVRTSELIEAQWQEFDLDAAEWLIPPERTGRKGKTGERRPHLVPLSRQALEVLSYLRAGRGDDHCKGAARLFPGERDHEKPMSNGAILMALKRMGYRGRQTGHGFRGIASTWANESGYRHDVIEAQLSHIEPNRTRGAYNHAIYLDERRELMQAWADWLDAVKSSGKVIPFRKVRSGAAA